MKNSNHTPVRSLKCQGLYTSTCKPQRLLHFTVLLILLLILELWPPSSAMKATVYSTEKTNLRAVWPIATSLLMLQPPSLACWYCQVTVCVRVLFCEVWPQLRRARKRSVTSPTKNPSFLRGMFVGCLAELSSFLKLWDSSDLKDVSLESGESEGVAVFTRDIFWVGVLNFYHLEKQEDK